MRTAVRLVLFTTVVLAVSFASCRKLPPDFDDQQPKALRISPGVLVKDSVAPSDGDRIDWKDFSYYTDVRVSVVFAFGEMYKPHGVEGEITLFSFDGNVIQRQPVVPEKRDYDFRFTARKDKDYFFKVEAFKGSSGYMVETKVTPLDACASCPPGTTCCRPTGLCCNPGTSCVNGACVKPAGCMPPCRRGELCIHGQCEKACPRGCPRGRRCDVKTRQCVRKKARPPRPLPPKPHHVACRPACGPDQTCNTRTGECEGGNQVVGRVLSAVEKGALTEILINRGSRDGVKRGAHGRVGGHGFTITYVSATRSRAKVKAPADQVKGKRTVISR